MSGPKFHKCVTCGTEKLGIHFTRHRVDGKMIYAEYCRDCAPARGMDMKTCKTCGQSRVLRLWFTKYAKTATYYDECKVCRTKGKVNSQTLELSEQLSLAKKRLKDAETTEQAAIAARIEAEKALRRLDRDMAALIEANRRKMRAALPHDEFVREVQQKPTSPFDWRNQKGSVKW